MRAPTSPASRRHFALPIAVAAAVAFLASAGPVAAQSNDNQALLDRIQRLERDVRTLNIQIARGVSHKQAAQEAGAAGGGSVGESPSVPAPAIALLGQRADQMESDIRSLTGRVEEINHRLSELQQRLDKLSSDVEFRLSRLEGGNGAAANGSTMGSSMTSNGTNAGAASQQAGGQQAGGQQMAAQQGAVGVPSSQPAASVAGAPQVGQGSSSGTGLAPGSQTLGTISQSAVNKVREQAATQGSASAAATSADTSGLPALPALPGVTTPGGNGAATPPASATTTAAPQPATQQPAAPKQAAPAQQEANANASGGTQPVKLPAGSPDTQYKYAFGLLRQGRYQDAADAFTQFLDQHPNDQLASNARYWLGETHYVRADFYGAAQEFLEVYKKGGKNGPKAPDALLKLGMSMARLDKVSEACAAFNKVKQDYPHAPAGLRGTLDREMKQYKCGG